MSEPKGKTWSERLPWMTIVMWVAIAASLLVVAWSVWAHDAADAGRGGAFGTAVTFVALIAGRGTAASALKYRLKPPSEMAGLLKSSATEAAAAPDPSRPATQLDLERLTGDLASVRNAVSAYLDSQRRQSRQLMAASIVSTAAWGFGDMLVAYWPKS